MREENKSIAKEKKLRYDIIFIAALLLISSVGLFFSYLFRKDGDTVVVIVDNEEVARYPLSKNGEYSINGGTNIIVIEDGDVYMKYSTCRGRQDCVEKGRQRKDGDFIICTKNKVHIKIEKVSEEKGTDINPEIESG